MKISQTIRSASTAAAIVLALALAGPQTAVAGEYEDALAVIEAVYGPVGDTNPSPPGTVDWRVIDITTAAKRFKASADDARALALILEAEALVSALQ